MNLSFKKACVEDCEILIDINNKAYYDDYIRYGVCPGYNIPIEEMKGSIEHKDIEKYLICVDNKPIGAVSVRNEGNKKYYLGNLCIIPEYQHKGIGKAAIDFLLDNYKDMKELNLITPADKIQNVRFYTKKCNFTITNEEDDCGVKVVRFEYKR